MNIANAKVMESGIDGSDILEALGNGYVQCARRVPLSGKMLGS